MRIFVTGATGLLGKRVVTQLVAEGHEVTAVARRDEKAEWVRSVGAEPVSVSLFDAAALTQAMAGHDAVANLATHIPPISKAAQAGAWAENDRIRTEGSTALVDAALATGVALFIQESLAFQYPDHGDEWVPSGSPLVTGPVADAVRTAEGNVARFASGGGRGVVLRFGRFYGPDSDYTRAQVRAARLGFSTEVGLADGYQPLIALDDAASAVVAALSAGTGAYDVVDDVPLTRREIDQALAEALGGRRLRRWGDAFVRRAGPAAGMMLRSMRVTNQPFRAETGWVPALPSAREGWRSVVETLRIPTRLPSSLRLVLWVLVLSGVSVGLQAQFWPSSFYESFPFGRGWIALDGPYNEHLVRDVGGLNLALAVMAAGALLTNRVVVVRTAALAWLVYALPHAIYHASHLHGYGAGDAFANVVSTWSIVVLPLLALVLSSRHASRRQGGHRDRLGIGHRTGVSAGAGA
jgi:nucleoside-diphosphate-sugar epimerase